MARKSTAQEFTSLEIVEREWERLRRGQFIPYRSELDPRGIEDALPYAFIAERFAPGMLRLRIAGTHLSDLMGMEVRGMPLSALFTPGSRDRIAGIGEDVLARPAAARLSLVAERGIGQPELVARLLLLPLRDDQGAPARLLGCLESEGNRGKAPRRFDITEGVAQRIVARRPVREPAGTSEDTQPAFREEAAPFVTLQPSGKAPYLRVVRTEPDAE